MTIKPNVPKNLPNLWLKKETISIQQEMLQVKPFIVISIMVYLCNAIDPNNKIKSKILSLFKNNPNIPIHKIGFFTNSETPSISWQQEPLWA